MQGAFGALLAPAALALIAVTFVEPKERARAFGVFGAIAGGGSAVGLLNSVINVILLMGANALSRKVNETSLW